MVKSKTYLRILELLSKSTAQEKKSFRRRHPQRLDTL